MGHEITGITPAYHDRIPTLLQIAVGQSLRLRKDSKQWPVLGAIFPIR